MLLKPLGVERALTRNLLPPQLTRSAKVCKLERSFEVLLWHKIVV